MMQLAIIIAKDVNERLAMLNERVTPVIAEEIAQMMKDNTSMGTSFGKDTYDATYQGYDDGVKNRHSGYARKRERAGVPPAPVTLRFKTKSIESTRVEPSASGSTIVFTEPTMGVIFKYHHDGIQYSKVGFKTRSIFPKTADSIPQSIKDMAERLIGEALRNGR